MNGKEWNTNIVGTNIRKNEIKLFYNNITIYTPSIYRSKKLILV